jgi:hypothetical protein
MRPKILIAAGLAAAFVVGAMANGFYTATTRAFNPVPTDEYAITSFNTRQPAPAVNRTRLVQPRTVYVSNPAPVRSAAPATVEREKKRSVAKEALIIGGSAGAGAAVGAVAGGKKGAAIGAISGGVAGLIYDLATRNK